MRLEGVPLERRLALGGEIERDVEADAAHADNRHLGARLHPAGEHVDIARHPRVLDAWDLRTARREPEIEPLDPDRVPAILDPAVAH